MSCWRACECEIPTPTAPPTATSYTNRCTCGGEYVVCGRCLRPLGDGKEHGLMKCFPPSDDSAVRAA